MSNEKAPIALPVISLNESKFQSNTNIYGKKIVSCFEVYEDVFFKIDAISTCTSFDKEVTQINSSGILYFVPLSKKEVFEKVMEWMAIDGYTNNAMINDFKEFYRFQ